MGGLSFYKFQKKENNLQVIFNAKEKSGKTFNKTRSKKMRFEEKITAFQTYKIFVCTTTKYCPRKLNKLINVLNIL